MLNRQGCHNSSEPIRVLPENFIWQLTKNNRDGQTPYVKCYMTDRWFSMIDGSLGRSYVLRHPCSRDANLWRPQIGRLSFFHYPPPPHPRNWPSFQWEWLRTLYDLEHDVHTIKIWNHHFDDRNNLCQWLNTCKNAPETVLRIRKIQLLS